MSDPSHAHGGIPLADGLVPYTPPSLEDRDPKPVFELQTITTRSRDDWLRRLSIAGIYQQSRDVQRAIMTDALYGYLPEGEAEARAIELEILWRKQDDDERAVRLWREREEQRRADAEAPDAPAPEDRRPPEAFPTLEMTRRDNARLTMLSADISANSERVRAMIFDLTQFGPRLIRFNVCYFLKRVDNDPEAPTLEWDGDGLLTDECYEALRARYGGTAMAEIGNRAQTSDLPETERKNSGSPVTSTRETPPSSETGGGSGTTDGSSTGSNTSPTPSGESGSATPPSSTSGGAVKGGKKRSSRMAAG